MATFLQNLAPAVSALGGGYLKGQAETQEKARTEQLELDKTALSTYYKLLESGHFDAVDPSKGVPEGQVIKIGGMFLVPKDVTKDTRFVYYAQRQEFDREEQGWKREDWERKVGDTEAERAHKLKMRSLDVDIANAQLAAVRERGDKKELEDEYTDMSNGITVKLTKAEYDKIIKVPESALTKDELRLRKAYENGTLVKGKPSTITEKPTTPGQDLKVDIDKVNLRMKLLKEASLARDDTKGKEIESGLNTVARDDDTFAYVWKPKTDFLVFKAFGGLKAIHLPQVKTVGGATRQMTMKDIRDRAKETNTTVDVVLQQIIAKGLPQR